VAQAVGYKHDTHLAAQFHRLAAHRGKKRAAVAHSILIIVYHIIRWGTVYTDLGANYFNERKTEAVQHQLVKRLDRLQSYPGNSLG
jgi:transposase